MAWSTTTGGLYVANWIDILDASQLAIDLSLTSHKIALQNNSATPNFSTDAQWSNTNEVTGTGWVTGGIALSAAATGSTSVSPTLTESPTGSIMYDHTNDTSVASTTLSAVRAARIYETVLGSGATKALIVGIGFGADYSTSNGTFGIQWAATGIFAIDVTP